MEYGFPPLRYEWDEDKRAETLREREIDFASMDYFDWETAIHRRSDREGETRWASFGLIGNRVHHVVWTERGENIRIISLRKANSMETRRYVEQCL
jgi:uncharacterized DUF497 family protein